MNILLIFFALPIAVIIISIALQKILKNPALVAAVIFAVFLVVTFIVSDLIFLVATIVYTIISYITAVIVWLICRFLRDRDSDCSSCRSSRNRESNCCRCGNSRERNSVSNDLLRISSNCQNFDNGNLLTISSSCCNGVTNDLLTVNSASVTNDESTEDSCSNSCSNCDNSNNTVSARISVIPNDENNGRTGAFSGHYRRRE